MKRPKTTLAKKGSLFFSRKKCTDIFVNYVETYLETIKTGQYNIPTIMFVMQERGKKRPDPSVVPHELKKFHEKALEQAALHAVSYSDVYDLDMVMYCNFEDDYKKKDEFGVTFGCRDGYGNTIHQMWRYDRKKGKFTERDIIPNHNVWLPPTGKHERFPDPILTKLAMFYSFILAEKGEIDANLR